MKGKSFAVWVLLILGFLDFFAVSITIPLIAVNFKNKGYSPFLYGLAGTTYGTIQTISGPILGSYSDAHGRKKCLLLSFYLSGLVYGGFFLFDGIVPFLILRGVLGFFKHSNSMCKTYLCDITPESELAAVIGRFNAISSAGFIVGPLVGAHVDSFERGCLVTAVLFMACGAFAQICLPERSAPKATALDTPKRSALEACRSLDWLQYWDLLGARLLCSLAVVLYRSNLGFLLSVTHSLSAKEIGYVMSLSGAVAACSGFLAGPIAALFKVDRFRLLAASTFVLFSALVVLCLSSTVQSLLLILMVCTMSSSLARVYALDAILSIGTGSDVGLLQGVSQSMASVSRGSAPLICGILQQLHRDLPAATAACMALVGTLLNIHSMRKTHLKVE